MSKKYLWSVLALACLMTAPILAQSTPVCGPLDDGRVANVFYEGTAVFFEPIVEYEYDFAVLTISGPCEDIVRTFKSGEGISFDIREIERVTDGHYTWQLRFEPTIDPGVREELQASRGSGKEDDVWWSYWQKGAIPVGPRVDSASFTVFRGGIIDPNSGEEKSASLGTKGRASSVAAVAAGAVGGGSTASEEGGGPVLGTKDVVYNDDVIIIGSLCVGFDCVNGEVFSFDTIRLKENNLRIKFEDTSGGSFPTRDWEIEANSSANGGQTHFRINDVDASRSPFTVEGNAPSHSLYVDSTGRVGFGTSTPILELHVANGDTPALRLDQNTSSGFASQVWDVAGNETNFFVRDVTSGSTLPFRIFPGASSSSLVIDDTNDIGVGTTSPQKPVHIVRGTNPGFRLEDNSGTGSSSWDFELNANGLFQINKAGSGGAEVLIRERQDPGGLETMDVDGSIEADAFNLSSSRTFKTGFEPVDATDVLARVLELPVSEWSFKWDERGTRHIGPMAEDFLSLFSVGNDSTNISVGDVAGVALAAIQGLYQELQAKEQENADLRSRQEMLEARLQELEERFDSGAHD